jgi:tRNA pseudouridine13 synthase
LRVSFVRAYQCFLWNTIVSKRIAKFGAKLIVGDLVYASGNNDQNNTISLYIRYIEFYIELLIEMEGDSGRRDYNGQQNQREVLFIDQNNIHNYTIYDAVLPLPGCNITYPANEVADWYKDLLSADGLLEKDFNLSLK